MKTLLSFACLLLLIVVSVRTADADVARPKQPEQKPKIVLRTKLDIVPDGKVWQARLQLTQSDLQELRAALDGASGNAALGSGNVAGSGGFAASIALSSVRTIVAGLLLFVAVSFAGVWLARVARRSSGGSAGGPPGASFRDRISKIVPVGILVASMLGAAAIITRGNAGPPPEFRNWGRLPKNFTEGRPTSGDFVIEVVPDEANRPPGVKLLIPYSNAKQAGDE